MKNVLILDSQPETRKLLEKMIQEADSDAKVFKAGCIEEAYVYAMKSTMDVFIVDLVLTPGKRGGKIEGAEFIQKIREVKKYYFTPVIIVTSLYDSQNLLYAETHCFRLVEKPFDEDALKHIIRRAMEYKTRRSEDAMWYYKLDGMVGAVRLKDIIYAKSAGQALTVVAVKETVQLPYKTCQDFLKELDAEEFAMCKRGIIVHRTYIRKIDAVNKYIYLDGCKDVLEIGTIMKKSFMAWFYEG